MTLQEFIDRYDHEKTVVLLEGKRNVLETDREKLTTLGRLLTENTKKMTFRSGNADGSDLLFSRGVVGIDPSRLQVITPYTGHRQRHNKAYDTVSLDDVDLAAESELVEQSMRKIPFDKLINQYVAGTKNKQSIKAAYIIRDTLKAIGGGIVKPATFGFFYDDLSQPMAGGTGHTMKVCLQNNIPIIDQKTWMGWI